MATSTPKKPIVRKPNVSGGFQARADGKPRKKGGVPTKGSRGGEYQPLRAPDAAAAARAIYEGTPGCTCLMVSEQTGVPNGTVRRWKAEASARGEPWVSRARNFIHLLSRAGALANSFKVKMTELGKPMDDAVATREAEKAVVEEYAVDVRANILDRHRKEWSAPRAVAYEAISKRDFDLAKLAKITSETLTLIQVGECRAYGINHDSRSKDGANTILIDREGNVKDDDGFGPNG